MDQVPFFQMSITGRTPVEDPTAAPLPAAEDPAATAPAVPWLPLTAAAPVPAAAPPSAATLPALELPALPETLVAADEPAGLDAGVALVEAAGALRPDEDPLDWTLDAGLASAPLIPALAVAAALVSPAELQA
jgi:hypothetical protein